MDFFYGIVALLAFVVLVLTVLTAWLYVQQSRLSQSVSAITAALTAPPPSFFEAARRYPVEEEEPVPAPTPNPTPLPEDDRVSIHEENDTPDAADAEDAGDAAADVDENDLSDKKVAELRDLLTGKGIPFNKSDKKGVLLNLLKAAS